MLKNATLRRCNFEVMEERKVLSADPVVAGVTYLEGDAGQDITPDHFEVTFQGGAETTQLTQFVINGDQDGSGTLSDGDIFFDANDQLPGTGGFHEFIFDEANSSGITADDVRSVSVSEDGLVLTVDVDNFEAGDVFAFTIDVDEVESFRNDRIASGVEFEGSQFSTTFTDENNTFEPLSVTAQEELEGGFIQDQFTGIFFDEFDTLLAEGESVSGGALELERDNETGQADRTAGAVDAFELVEIPISISGNVFHDEDLDCVHDGTEEGISGVNIDLQLLNEATGQYETVASTVTNADGSYEFGRDLGLTSGTYQLVQTQPDGFLDVGAVAGSSGGDILQDEATNSNIITNIEIPVGNTDATGYDFKEVQPASLEGNVFHDEDNDGVFDPNEEGIADVLIQVTRVGAKDGVTNDPFADFEPVFVTTDENGHYSVDSLPPGIYEVLEINNYPPGQDPLAAFIDGRDSIGNIDGVDNGIVSNDRFTEIELCPGEHGQEYNFGEIQFASISGFVSVGLPGEAKLSPDDPGFQPIEGVSIQLFNENNELVAETVTDANGNYEFDELLPGTYSVVEVQPGGFIDGADVLGTVDGQTVGTVSNDRFEGITLNSGDEAVNFNFCEHEPASIKGTVYHDRNNNGIQDEGEEGIAGVTIELFDAEGNLVQTAITDENGHYCFEDLPPGEYKIREQQPDGFDDGIDTVGQVDGEVNGEHTGNDEFCVITLGPGDQGTEYNFGELILAEISGFVHVDNDGDGVFGTTPSDRPIEGATLELLNEAGEVIATTVTDAEGAYSFGNLLPDTYSIRQIQPDEFFTGGEFVGDGGGTTSTNQISNIVIESGQNLSQYNFCEHDAAEIHGRVFEDGPAFVTEDGVLPDDFRDQRDGVFQAGVDTPIQGVQLQLFYFIDPTAGPEGEIAPRPVTISEVQSEFYENIDASNPDAPVWVETNADGEYYFLGLPPGSYVVLEIQPEGFVDANDVPGTTTGFTFNNESDTQTAIAPLTSVFSDVQLMDAVAGISVDPGGVSQQNNFTEVSFTIQPPEPPPEQETFNPPTPQRPAIPGNPVTPRPGITGLGGLGGSEPSAFTQFVGTSRGASFQTQATATNDAPYAWHLSVINGGSPRAAGGDGNDDSIWQQAGFIGSQEWTQFDTEEAVWTFTELSDDGVISVKPGTTVFGMLTGTPLAGDFNGDGTDEIAVFSGGYWLIDLNGNGRWDEEDLLAKLGDAEDRPVVGDWDGDGKDDIGIFGPMWEKDQDAIEHEPGLPNPANSPFTRPKNVPPADVDATNGARLMKLTSYGTQRADVVDHVFGIEDGGITPVTGDWNGNGIRSIGRFEDGNWDIDTNGDGRFDEQDEVFQFGRTGDIPLVGDFNGDGIEEIAVYRSGRWLIDTNGNRELDATDKTFDLGGASDRPIVGDFNGDGVDEPAIYTPRSNNVVDL